MSLHTSDRNESLLLTAALLGGGAALGLVAADAIPTPLRLLVVVAVLALAAMDLLLYSSHRAPQWLVGTTIVGMALANAALPIAGIMAYGRFVPPLVLFAAVVRTGAWRDGQGRTRSVMIASGIGIFLVTVSTLSSLDPGVTFQKSLAVVSVVAGACAAVRWSVGHSQALRDAALIAFGLLVFSNAAMLAVGGDVYSGSRFRGWTINPNSLGILCAFAVPLAASEVMTRVGRRRVMGVVVLMAAGLLLLLSGSRSSSLGALLALATVLRISQVARSLVFVGGTLALVILAPLAFRSASDAQVFSAVERQGNSGRTEVWPVAIDEIKKRPLTGAGFSTTEPRFAAQEFGRFSVFQGGQFHNSYLGAAVELGVAGGIFLLAAGVFALWHIVRPVLPEYAWAAGMAVAGATVGVFETGLLTAGSLLMFPFWMALGVLTVRQRPSVESARPQARELVGV